MTDERFEIENRPEESRYVLLDRGDGDTAPRVIGEESYLEVAGAAGTERIFYHTAVSQDYSGQGLASVLVRAAVEDSVSLGHSIVPVCPYVVTWFEQNTEFAKHEVTATPGHLEALRELED